LGADNVTFYLMEHITSSSFKGSPEKVFGLITTVFTSNGYNLASRDAQTLRFESEARAGLSRIPMLGASTVMFSIEGERLTMRADMGGVRKMGTLIILLPVALAAILLAIFGILFGELGPRFIAIVSLGPVLPWVLLAPLLIRWLKNRSAEALDRLLESIVKAGGA
jgi:hypothetical protein